VSLSVELDEREVYIDADEHKLSQVRGDFIESSLKFNIYSVCRLSVTLFRMLSNSHRKGETSRYLVAQLEYLK